MAAATNTITTTVMTNAQIREVDFTLRFTDSIKKLVEALGVTRKVPMQAGTTLKTYTASGTLSTTNPGEGETIPLSQYAVTANSWGDITLKKWRKATTAEAIIKYGYEQAVDMTTERMLKDVQKTIRSDFFTVCATGTGTATGAGLQAALANAWGKLQVLFEDSEIESVFFVNPLDVADYLGGANITVQTAFGMSYVENFLGLGTLILNSSVTKGSFYATAKENLVLYYIPVNGEDMGDAFAFTSDETGYIGIHEDADYSNMTATDTVVSGLVIFPENLAGIVKGTITAQA